MRYKKIAASILAVLTLSGNLLPSVQVLAAQAAEDAGAVQAAEEQAEPKVIAEGSVVFTAPTLGEQVVSGVCGKNTEWKFDSESGILVISGSGSVIEMTYKNDDFLGIAGQVKSIFVDQEVTALNEGIFQDCKNVEEIALPFAGLNADNPAQKKLSALFGENPEYLTTLKIMGGTVVPAQFAAIPTLQTVVLADTITEIGDEAFYGTAIEALTLPSGLKTIGRSAFNSCASLKSLTVPETVAEIGEYAFAYCDSLESMELPASLKSIGSSALESDSNLKTLTIPALAVSDSSGNGLLMQLLETNASLDTLTINGGTVISNLFATDSWYDYIKVDNLVIGNTVTEIGNSAFSSCGLKSVTLPDSLTTIGDYAFASNSDLTEITLPESLCSIGKSAFYNCGLSSVQIPSKVTAIGDSAFSSNASLTSAALPDGLLTIGNYAFSNTALTEAVIPASVRSIGYSVFSGCDALTALTLPFAGRTENDRHWLGDLFDDYIPASLVSLTILGGTTIPQQYCSGVNGSELQLETLILGDSITTIETGAFEYCPKLLNIQMPENLVSVGSNAFRETAWMEAQDNGIVYAGNVALCYKGRVPNHLDLEFREGTVGIAEEGFRYSEIESITLPEGLRSIDGFAFADCTGITEIVLPDSLETLGTYAFYGCENLSKVTLSENIEHAGKNPFEETPWNDSKPAGAAYLGKVFVGYNGTMPRGTTLKLKDGTTEIGEEALQECTNLVGITLPDSLRSIGYRAFVGCTGLKSIVIPDSVTTIESNAFGNCSALASVELPDGLTVIPAYAFYDCVSLKKIVIPDSVTEIGDSAFYNNYVLRDITLPAGLKDYDSRSPFGYSENRDYDDVERVLHFTANTETITEAMTESLRRDIIAVDIAEGVKAIGENAFQGAEKLTKITLPDSVTAIGQSAFDSCNKLSEVTLSQNLEEIGDYAFQSCTALAEIALPDKLTAIGSSAFSGCTALTAISLPDTVTALGSDVFFGCSALASAKLSNGLKTLPYGTFSNCSALTAIVIPEGIETVESGAFSNCNALTDLTVPGTLKETKTLSRSRLRDSEQPNAEDVKLTLHFTDGTTLLTKSMTEWVRDVTDTIVLPDALTGIGEYALSDFDRIKEISIPETVTSIASYAFSGCDNLSTVTVPAAVTSLGSYAFSDCDSLITAEIPDAIKVLSEGLFSGCERLSSVKYSPELKSIEDYTFYECKSLNKIRIPATVQTISDNAFDYSGYYDDDTNRYSVSRTVIYGDGIEYLTPDLVKPFRSSLVNAILPDSLLEIYDHTFEHCRRLETVVLPESLTVIGEAAFADCSSLQSLTIPESVTALSASMCSRCSSLQSVTLPAAVSRIPSEAFYYCQNLSEINSPVEDFRFRASSFYGCASLYDPRFMILDKRAFNFSQNSGTESVDGIVHFSINYKLTPFMTEEKISPKLMIHLPYGLEMTDQAAFEEDGDDYYMQLNETSGTIKFSAYIREYGSFNVAASLEFYYDDESWNESIGVVNVQAPAVSLSAPSAVSAAGVKVSGIAKPGSTVSIYANDTPVGEAKANENSGKYMAEVKLPAIEEGSSYDIYAVCDENESSHVYVLYQPDKPLVEEVWMTYNGTERIDITTVFTEGRHPVISFNPAYPFRFEVKVTNADRVANLYVTSEKGGEKKRIEGFWDAEKQMFVAYGYFDPDNTSYTPGGLNISIFECKPVMIDLKDDKINATDEQKYDMLRDIPISLNDWLNEKSISDLKPSEIINADQVPEAVSENTTAKVKYQTDKAAVIDYHVSDGKKSENATTYIDNSTTIYINGNQVTANIVAKNPGSYGFNKTGLSVRDENGVEYDYYTRVPDTADIALQVYDSFSQEGSMENSPMSRSDMLVWRNGTGTETLAVPRSSSAEPSFSNTFVAVGDAVVKAFEKYDDVTNPNHPFEQPVSFAADLALTMADELDTFIGSGFDKMISEIVENTPSKDGIWNWAKDEFSGKNNKSFSDSGTLGKISKIKNVIDIVGTGVQMVDRLNKLKDDDNGWLKAGVIGIAAAKTAWTLGGSHIENLAGAALGSVFGPVGFVVGKVGTHILGNLLLDLADKWIDNKVNEAYKQNGKMKYLIDPSGYVYEAVAHNRLKGAKMTISYQDPESGEEIEWTADDYDQQNPLLTDQLGEYAWDVPEGKWRVKFELDGYETAYSEWMDVPPEQTDVNFAAVSKAVPEIESAMLMDGVIQICFTKYMDPASVNSQNVTLKSGKDIVSGTIKPVYAEKNDKYTDTFQITGDLPSGQLTVSFTEGCTSYAGTAMKAATAVITVPEKIIGMTVSEDNLIAAQNTDIELTVTAKPASIAANKKLIVEGGSDGLHISEAVFDEKGTAKLTMQAAFTGTETLTLHVDGSALTVTVTVSVISEREYEALQAAEPEVLLGDVNNDGQINAKDVVMIRRYIAGGLNVTLDERVADVNKDGNVNLKDVVLIRRYIAGGWDVKLGAA